MLLLSTDAFGSSVPPALGGNALSPTHELTTADQMGCQVSQNCGPGSPRRLTLRRWCFVTRIAGRLSVHRPDSANLFTVNTAMDDSQERRSLGQRILTSLRRTSSTSTASLGSSQSSLTPPNSDTVSPGTTTTTARKAKPLQCAYHAHEYQSQNPLRVGRGTADAMDVDAGCDAERNYWATTRVRLRIAELRDGMVDT